MWMGKQSKRESVAENNKGQEAVENQIAYVVKHIERKMAVVLYSRTLHLAVELVTRPFSAGTAPPIDRGWMEMDIE